MRTLAPTIIAIAALFATGCSSGDSKTKADDPATATATSSSSSTARAAPTAFADGTYSTAPLSAAFLLHAGFTHQQVLGKKTVFTLKLQQGTYVVFDAEDGKAPNEGDSGTYEVRGHVISFVSSGDGARSEYTYRRTAHGFQLHVKKFVGGDATGREIATVVWTSAPYHRT